MNEFQKIRLGDYIEILTDYHANGSYEVLEKNITLKSNPDFAVMIRTLNFERSDFKNQLIYLNETEYDYLSKTKVYPDDILMNKIANPGTVYLMPDLKKPVSLAMNLFLIRFNSKMNQQFMYYLMKNNEKYIKRLSGGTTTHTIRKDVIRDIEFMVPSKAKQDSIANFLTALNSKIELSNKIIEKLEAMTKLIYDYWFVQFDFPDENGKPYKSSGGKMVYDKNLKRKVPYGWKVRDFGTDNEIRRGDLITSDTIKNGNVKLVSAGVKSSHFHDQANRSENVITVSSSGANAGYINFWREPIFASDCITVQTTSIGKTILAFQYLKMIQKHIYRKASGSAQPHVYPSDLSSLKYLLPPKDLIDLFESKIIFTNELIGYQNQKKDKLEKMRDWLVPILMNGQVTVSEAS